MLTKFIDKAIEDSLTAAVFSHLLHLPNEIFWRILSRACYKGSLPTDPGEPLIYHSWPKWNPSGITTHTNYVEPDIFVRFASFDLIIEAKRWDNNMQDPDQWQRELIAYANEYGKDKRPVRMIALGGIHSESVEQLKYEWCESATEYGGVCVETHPFNCTVHMCRWSTLLLECQRLKRELEEKNKHTPTSRTSADIRILNDLIAFFAVHGYVALRWFEDFDFKSNLPTTSVNSDQQYFCSISLQFQAS